MLLPVLVFLCLVAFVESRLFLGLANHPPFDGSLIDWSALHRLAALELVVIAGLAIVLLYFRKNLQLLSSLSLFILLFLSVGLLHQVYLHRAALFASQPATDAQAAYFDGFSRLSKQQNVIHIVPDQAQGAMLHDILRGQQQRFGPALDGFTLFTQATGQYKSTYPSVLFYMSGEAPKPDYDLVSKLPFTWEYIDSTLGDKSVVSTLARNGFRTYGFQFHPGIFCKGEYTACTGTHAEIFGGGAIRSPARRLANAVTTGLDMGLFQVTPVLLRRQVFNDGQWLLRKLSQGEPTHSGILDLFMRNLQTGDAPGTYNYFHHAGAHAPLLFDRDCNFTGPRTVNQENQREQANCTLAQLVELIQALQDKQLYDQTMIVVNGDHGSPWLPDGYTDAAGALVPESLMGSASTLLLVKPPGARGALRFSEIPASIGDIPATIVDALGLENPHAGLSLFGAPPETGRERFYYTYAEASRTHNLQVLPELTRYRIRGDVFDENSWVLPNAGDTGDAVSGFRSQLRVDHPDFMAYTHGFSWLEQQATPVRWVDGTQAGVLLLPPQTGSLALVFETYVPPNLSGQWLEVRVQDRAVATLDENELKKQRHVISLNDDLPRDQVLEIEFTLGKSFKPERDSRHLSILFKYIGLVPAG